MKRDAIVHRHVDTSNPTPALRPLGMGELIDRAAVLWRQHLGTLFRLYLVLQLITFMLGKAFELAAVRWFPVLRGGPAAAAVVERDPADALRQFGTAYLALMPLLFVSLWIGWIISVAGSHYLIRRQLGERATLADALARARARLGTTTGAFLASSLWGFGVATVAAAPGLVVAISSGLAVMDGPADARPAALLAAVAGGLLSLFGVLVAALWWVLRFLLTPQVIAMEDTTAWASIRRSGALLRGRLGPGLVNHIRVRAMILLTLVFVILFVISLLSSIPVGAVQMIYANPLAGAGAGLNAPPQALLVPAQLFQVLVQAVFAPLYLVFTALFYVDLRVRREGLDLELQLARDAAPVDSP